MLKCPGFCNVVHIHQKCRATASKRGLSDEQVPILVALDRSGTTTCSVLPSVTADNVQAVLEPRMDDDILMVTDGNNIYPPCAKSPGIKHKPLNQSAGERVRGAIHIQTVNNRHSRFKDFLRRFHGVSTKYLGIYLHWFERYEIAKSSPRSYLATATGGPCIRFSNCAKFISRILLYSNCSPPLYKPLKLNNSFRANCSGKKPLSLLAATI